MTTPTIPHLERRRIEAAVLVPLVQAFRQAFGTDAADAVLRRVIDALARADGAGWADRFGSGLTGLGQVAELWADGGAMDIEPGPPAGDELQFAVTRCRYAEIYQDLGLAELGVIIHCSRDAAMTEAFDPGLSLTRTQTLMEGASHCDFRFRRKP